MPQAKSSAKSSVQRNTSKDLTAKKQAEADEAKKKEQAEAAERMSTATAEQEQQQSEELINYTDDEVPEEELEAVGAKTVTNVKAQKPEERPKKVTPKNETIRARETVEFTLGVGNRYSFEAGKAYSVPFNVAEHMREKGLLW